jgi:hypothetical protein
MEWHIELRNTVYTRVTVVAETEEEALQSFNEGNFHDSVTIDETWPEVLEVYPARPNNDHEQDGA